MPYTDNYLTLTAPDGWISDVEIASKDAQAALDAAGATHYELITEAHAVFDCIDDLAAASLAGRDPGNDPISIAKYHTRLKNALRCLRTPGVVS